MREIRSSMRNPYLAVNWTLSGKAQIFIYKYTIHIQKLFLVLMEKKKIKKITRSNFFKLRIYEKLFFVCFYLRLTSYMYMSSIS